MIQISLKVWTEAANVLEAGVPAIALMLETVYEPQLLYVSSIQPGRRQHGRASKFVEGVVFGVI